MKPTFLLALALCAALTGDAPQAPPQVSKSSPAPAQLNLNNGNLRRAAASLGSWARALEGETRSARSVGNLWTETARLKRQGANVRQIEWHVSDLEAALRRNPQDAQAKRHILNNLQYEIQRMKNRQR
jgi:hypothetical protein